MAAPIFNVGATVCCSCKWCCSPRDASSSCNARSASHWSSVSCYAVLRPPMLRVAVVLPMYNEADNVEVLIERLQAVRQSSGLDLSIVAVDDGSRDATFVRLSKLLQRFPFLRIVRHDRNRGMAAALRTGVAQALA